MTEPLKRPQDPSRIDVNDAEELKYWSKVLNRPEEAIKDAVRTVGVSSVAVRIHLKQH